MYTKLSKVEASILMVAWLIILLFMIVFQANAQTLEMVRPADFRYYVVVDGDTLSQRSLDYKAFEDAVNYKCDYIDYQPESVVVQPIGVEIRGDCPSPIIYETIPIETTPDTVYVPQDTLYVPQVDTLYADTLQTAVYSMYNPDHNVLFNEVSWDLEISYDTTTTATGATQVDTTRYIDFIINTSAPSVDTLYTEVRCGNEWVETNMFVQPAESLLYGLIWNCSSKLTYQFRATNVDGWEETITNTYPLWMSTFDGMPPSAYDLYWGDMTYLIYDGLLTMELPERNIARIVANEVPMHRDIQVTVTEIVDTTHSTGVHLALRTSEAELEHSVETYLNNQGMGVSIFSNGSWSNPINFPVTWEYDVPITYTVTLVGDTLTVETGGEIYTYSSDVIGNTPNGLLTIGSTGAGIYKIVDLDYTILD